MTLAVRRASVWIDGALPGPAATLLCLLQRDLFAVGWQATKIVFLLFYSVLGTVAFKRACTFGVHLACFLATGLCLGFRVTVAVAHHPIGIFPGL